MLALHLGLRWLKRRRAAWLAVAAITVTVAVPVFVIDLFQGWYRITALQARANEADVTVSRPGANSGMQDAPSVRKLLADIPGVAGVAPVASSYAIMTLSRIDQDLRANLPCLVEGIDWEADWRLGRLRPGILHPQPVVALSGPPIPPERRGTGFLTPAWRGQLALSGLQVAAAFGALPCPLPPQAKPRPGVVCGRELLYGKGLHPGEEIQLTLPSGSGGTVGRISAEISDTLGSGVMEVDRMLVLTPLPLGQRLCGMQAKGERPARVSSYRLNADGLSPRALAARIEERAPIPLNVQTWEDVRGNLVKSLEIQRNIAIVVMIAIQLVTVFVIYAVFSTLVAEKRHDIGVLLGLGARRRDIAGAFLFAGLVACLVGGLLGWALSWGALAGLNPLSRATGFALFPEDVFYTPEAPTSFTWWIPPLFVGAMTVIGLIAVAWPAWRASRVDPIETLRENG